MAKQTILIELQVVDKNATKSTKDFKQSVDGVTKAQQDYFKALQPNNLQIEKYKILTAQATAATKQKAIAEMNAAAATKEGRTQSGLNNAILLETGRLASDASYGFTAIANNLSQVVSLFGSFVKTQGGVIASFKELGRSLIGSGGILIAIQLLISFGPKIFEFFQGMLGQSRLLAETFKDAGSTVEDSAGKFETYVGTLESATKSSSEKAKAIKKLNEEFPEYISSLEQAGISLDDVKNGTDAAKKANDEYRDSLLELAMARAAQNKIDELAAEQLQAEIDFKQELKDKSYEVTEQRYKEILAQREELRQSGITGAALEKAENRIGTAQERRYVNARSRFEESQDALKEQIETLVEYTKIEDKEADSGGRGGRGIRAKNFKQQLLNLEKLEESYRKKSIRDDILTEEEKISNQDLFEKEDLRIRLEAFKNRQDLRLKEFKDEQDLRLKELKESDATAGEIAEAEAKVRDAKIKAEAEVRESKIKAEQEAADVLVQIKAKTNTKFMMLETKRMEAEGKILEDLANKKIDLLKSELDYYVSDEYVQKKEAKLQQDVADAEFNLKFNSKNIEERAANEKKLFEAQTVLREEELANDVAYYEKKAAVQMQYVGFTEQVGSLIGKLAGDNEKMQEIALLIEKGAATAKVVIETQKANQIALATITSYAGTPLASATPFIKAQMVRNKIGAGLAIANIWATSTKSKSAGGGGGAGDGGGAGNVIQAPEFNVVGASPESQLAQTVSSAQAAPVKAFVVSKDISTQQELDRNTTDVASFG